MTPKIRTCQLGRRRSEYRHKARSIDDASAGVQALSFVDRILSHRGNSILATPPDTLEINLHGQVPYSLFRVQRVVILRMHDT